MTHDQELTEALRSAADVLVAPAVAVSAAAAFAEGRRRRRRQRAGAVLGGVGLAGVAALGIALVASGSRAQVPATETVTVTTTSEPSPEGEVRLRMGLPQWSKYPVDLRELARCLDRMAVSRVTEVSGQLIAYDVEVVDDDAARDLRTCTDRMSVAPAVAEQPAPSPEVRWSPGRRALSVDALVRLSFETTPSGAVLLPLVDVSGPRGPVVVLVAPDASTEQLARVLGVPGVSLTRGGVEAQAGEIVAYGLRSTGGRASAEAYTEGVDRCRTMPGVATGSVQESLPASYELLVRQEAAPAFLACLADVPDAEVVAVRRDATTPSS